MENIEFIIYFKDYENNKQEDILEYIEANNEKLFTNSGFEYKEINVLDSELYVILLLNPILLVTNIAKLVLIGTSIQEEFKLSKNFGFKFKDIEKHTNVIGEVLLAMIGYYNFTNTNLEQALQRIEVLEKKLDIHTKQTNTNFSMLDKVGVYELGLITEAIQDAFDVNGLTGPNLFYNIVEH